MNITILLHIFIETTLQLFCHLHVKYDIYDDIITMFSLLDNTLLCSMLGFVVGHVNGFLQINNKKKKLAPSLTALKKLK